MSRSRCVASAFALTVAAIAPQAMAQSASSPETLSEVMEMLRAAQADREEQKRRLAEQEERLRQHEEYIRRLTEHLARQSGGAMMPAAYPAVPDAPAAVDQRPRYVQEQPTPVPPTPRPPRERQDAPAVDERPEPERPTEQLLVERGGVLLREGALQLEPSLEYTHISSSRVAISGFTIFDAIVIGNIRVDDLQRDILTASLSTRYGLTDRIQLEARVPWVYRQDREVLGVGTSDERERTIDGTDIGDVETSVAWQATTQSGGWPAAVIRARARFPTGRHPFEIPRETVNPGSETRLTETPTGSGFYAVGLGPTFVWRADPAVYFVGGSYTMNMERSFPEFGSIDPGDTFEWFAGLNFALTEAFSLNLSFDNQITGSTTQNGAESAGTSSNDAHLVLGSSIGLTDSTSLIVSAAAGLTEQSPDYVFTISVPFTFSP